MGGNAIFTTTTTTTTNNNNKNKNKNNTIEANTTIPSPKAFEKISSNSTTSFTPHLQPHLNNVTNSSKNTTDANAGMWNNELNLNFGTTGGNTTNTTTPGTKYLKDSIDKKNISSTSNNNIEDEDVIEDIINPNFEAVEVMNDDSNIDRPCSPLTLINQRFDEQTRSNNLEFMNAIASNKISGSTTHNNNGNNDTANLNSNNHNINVGTSLQKFDNKVASPLRNSPRLRHATLGLYNYKQNQNHQQQQKQLQGDNFASSSPSTAQQKALLLQQQVQQINPHFHALNSAIGNATSRNNNNTTGFITSENAITATTNTANTKYPQQSPLLSQNLLPYNANLRQQLFKNKAKTGGYSNNAGGNITANKKQKKRNKDGSPTDDSQLQQQHKSRPAFVNKLWSMVNDPKTDYLISWSEDGKSFFVHNQEKFVHEVLPKYFKHCKIASFVRQLNMYGWHKVQDVRSGAMEDSSDDKLQFSNTNFIRGREDLLDLIIRQKTNNNHSSTNSINDIDNEIAINNLSANAGVLTKAYNYNINSGIVNGTSNATRHNSNYMPLITTQPQLDATLLVTELETIKFNQLAIAEDLKRLSKDHELLWKENIAAMKRHEQQERALEKMLKLMASYFGPGITKFIKDDVGNTDNGAASNNYVNTNNVNSGNDVGNDHTHNNNNNNGNNNGNNINSNDNDNGNNNNSNDNDNDDKDRKSVV
ncbi:uncharacterized protein SCODWIG_03052 [Saccharomycodes ludwigii]|uniref:Heat shock transcription factor n=1 Tax=Saccharomycodes ludwigii TaxID=36035 RepID=A0A376B9J5_9ASCO|nr:uncharacterized protein SCODWIG_03052 [Saccharomycodes ludwigii]